MISYESTQLVERDFPFILDQKKIQVLGKINLDLISDNKNYLPRAQ